MDVYGDVVDGGGDGEVFGGGVMGEEVCSGYCVGDGVMNECDETAPA